MEEKNSIEESLKFLHESVMSTKQGTKITVKKFNKRGELCYKDTKESLSLSDGQTRLIKSILERAGCTVEITRFSYVGLYDPSRWAELITLYPTDEDILETELRSVKYELHKLKNKKPWYNKILNI